MNQLNQKQKIIIGILGAIVIAAICYYVYAKEDTMQETKENELEVETKENKEQEQASDERVFVHVSGAVNKEGLVELKLNSRISDAIEQAGGLKEGANITDINLAYKVEDGMKIHIPTNQEYQELEKKETTKEEDSPYTNRSSGMMEESNQEKKEQINQVNLNTATQTQLETLPGIGPSTALKIINYRKEKGKFKTIEEIKEVSGIGDSKYEKMKEHICVK